MFTVWQKPKVAVLLPILLMSLTSHARAEDETSTFVMGSLGDSITMAFNAGGPLDRPSNSWAVGWSKNVSSHYERLLSIYDDVSAFNAARSGAVASELDAQITKLLAKANPDYVTILMGANDVCSWTADHAKDLEQYEKDMTDGVERLISANPDVKILLSPVPDMLKLWQVGRVNSCQGKWNFYKICTPLLGANRTEEERMAFVERLNDLNASLERIAEQHSLNVKYAAAVATANFEWKHISALDCFHPGVTGQNFLANEAWKDGWFAE